MYRISSLMMVALLVGCAPSPLAAVGALDGTSTTEKALRFEFAVAGSQIETSDKVAYYLVLDTDGQANDGPLVNGATPITYKSPDPRSYLPFVRDESVILDREPVQVPETSWTDYFVLTQEVGRLVMRQGRKNPDGSVNPSYRELKNPSEWGISGNKVQLNIPLSTLSNGGASLIEANLVVGVKDEGIVAPSTASESIPSAGSGLRGVLDRWSDKNDAFITIKTDGTAQSAQSTTHSITYPGRLPQSADASKVKLASFSAVVSTGK